MFKSAKAITLIALIITIIVLLVLAAITINMVLGENGLFNKAKTSVAKFENAQEKENTALGNYENLINSILGSRNVDTAALTSLINTIVDDKLKAGAGNPTGTIISYMAGTEAPEGYLKCDGTVYNISEHLNLAEAIKKGFGSYNYYGGDGTTTFAVPDLRGEFLRGTGTATRNTGTGKSVGLHQDATNHVALQFHNKGLNIGIDNYNSNEFNRDTFSNEDTALSKNATKEKIASSTSWTENAIFTYTSRPTNTSVLYCIKE